jgi:protein involved in plasmid replication-relaxation
MLASFGPVLDPLDGIPSGDPLDLRTRMAEAFAGSTIDREQVETELPLPDAIEELLDSNPTVDSERAELLIAPFDIKNPLSSSGPTLLRDQEVLVEIARYRILSFSHLRELIFSNRHGSVLTRRMQALEEAGYLSVWEERLSKGGHPRYALLTQQGLDWAIEALRAIAAGQAHEQLVHLMLGARPKKPLVLAPNTAPPFLPHQVETNRIAASFARAPSLGISWASTWHRPFPNEVRGVAMPQPDAVLVAIAGGQPHLLFLEHDRNQESPGSFAERKTQRYQLLLDLGLAPELLGFDTFTVLVTVVDPVHQRPFDRIRALQEVSAAAPIMRFTLAEWAETRPEAAVWFTPETRIETASLRPDDHAGLVSLFSNLRP